ncbi:Hypothetical protein P9303_13651 [Prochlorococcus marinus str. MIT 9303]|uniref:Uncharacterized protein n=1 Tax=Prochlorococcus marinus (strain MIT 9303) TaxID=59922 RepID=A2C9F2_PROM3|nr:Hypothetical protein P9303_13651 [Prochlorococcus marinus str. MIT 9303]
MIHPFAIVFAALLLCNPVHAMGCSGDRSHKHDGDSTEKMSESTDTTSKTSIDASKAKGSESLNN